MNLTELERLYIQASAIQHELFSKIEEIEEEIGNGFTLSPSDDMDYSDISSLIAEHNESLTGRDIEQHESELAAQMRGEINYAAI